MTGNTQKLSIRLLKVGLSPEDALREGVALADWDKLEGAKIALDTMGGAPPKWSRFLELSDDQKKKVYNNTAYGLVFLETSGRWFSVAFGMGHVKLDPAQFEQDFGLRVVLNAVDPKQLKSADVRTPDENTLSRRSQTSRGSDQTAFAIDVERDIVRGLAGTPKNPAFATRVAGTDALAMDRKLRVSDLPAACEDAYTTYQKTDYKTNFGWIDQIKHVRDNALIEKLNGNAVSALDDALKGTEPDHLHLAFPIIYDPGQSAFLRYKGFRSKLVYPDLELSGYLEALREKGKVEYSTEDFDKHTVHQVDDEGRDVGSKWKISECLVFETEIDGDTYVLSGGRWYQVDKNLADEVQGFFSGMTFIDLPEAKVEENEEKYNQRLKSEEGDLLCLDRNLVKASGATSPIEVCDFLGRDKRLIHVKDKTSSSRLSHLFSQGTVSGQVLISDGLARDKVRERIEKVQGETGQTGFQNIICGSETDFPRQEFTVVYAVIGNGEEAKLPFFSLVTLRQAVKQLETYGYKTAFAWIRKSAATGVKAGKSTSESASGEDQAELADLAEEGSNV